MDLKVVFAFVYLTIDIVYVVLSKSFYEQVVRNIQDGRDGFPPISASRAFAAIGSYTVLVIGWYVFAAGFAEQLASKGMHPTVAGVLAGATYGIVVYGVFNGTMHAMFRNYDIHVVLRDLAWGTVWATMITGVYMTIKMMRVSK